MKRGAEPAFWRNRRAAFHPSRVFANSFLNSSRRSAAWARHWAFRSAASRRRVFRLWTTESSSGSGVPPNPAWEVPEEAWRILWSISSMAWIRFSRSSSCRPISTKSLVKRHWWRVSLMATNSHRASTFSCLRLMSREAGFFFFTAKVLWESRQRPSGCGKGGISSDRILDCLSFIGNRPIHRIRDVIQGLVSIRSCRSLQPSGGRPSIYYISANGPRLFNREKLNKIVKGLSGLADKSIKRRRPRKVGKGGMGKADPTGNLP